MLDKRVQAVHDGSGAVQTVLIYLDYQKALDTSCATQKTSTENEGRWNISKFRNQEFEQAISCLYAVRVKIDSSRMGYLRNTPEISSLSAYLHISFADDSNLQNNQDLLKKIGRLTAIYYKKT